MRALTLSRFAALFLFATASQAIALQDPDDPQEETPGFVTVARWYGEMSGTGRSYATHEPGGWDFSPNQVKTTNARVVLREDVNKLNGAHHTVVESLSWSSTFGDLYYRNKDGTTVPAGSGGSGSGSYIESELIGEIVPLAAEQRKSFDDRIQEAAARVEAARKRMRETQAKKDALPAAAPPAASPAADDFPAQLQRASEEYQAILTRRDATAGERDQAQKKLQDVTQKFQKRAEELQEVQKGRQEEMEKQIAVLQDTGATEAQREAASQELDRLQLENMAQLNSLMAMALGPQAVMERELEHDLDEAKRELEDAEQDLRQAQNDLRRMENRRNPRARAEARVLKRDGKIDASVAFTVEDDKLVEYQADITPLDRVGFRTVLKTDYSPTKIYASMPGLNGLRFSGSKKVSDEKAAIIEDSEEHQGGEPGIIGGGESSRKIRFRRVGIDQQLIIRGSVLHRIRVPKDEKDDPFVMKIGQPGSLEGHLPVQGSVRVAGWFRDAEAEIADDDPPDIVADTDDGRFELALPLETNKRLRLVFTYANADAQLMEKVALIVWTNDILSARGEITGQSDGAVGLDDILRNSTSYTRYEKKLKEYPLMTETRGATVRREQGQTILLFEGFNSILINSFVLETPHLNQSLQAFSVRAKVPAQRLMQVSPQVLKATVAARMGVDADQPSAETETDVFIPGWSICHPTSVSMTLAGMGLLDLKIRNDRTEEVGVLAQGVYDTHARSKKPPWLFPFPANADAASGRALQQLAIALSQIPPNMSDVAQALKELNSATAKYTKWPFVEAGNEDAAKRWLVSIDAMRPWQHDDPLIAHLHGVYGGQISAATRYENLLQATSGTIVSNLLGGGHGAVISVDHLSSTGGQGGHLVALVGVVVDVDGSIVRTIVHDPWGDQSQSPTIEGYYNPGNKNDKSKYDKDGEGHRGAYAPYGPEINSFQGTLRCKRWIAIRHKTALAPQTVAGRLLPSGQWDGKLAK